MGHLNTSPVLPLTDMVVSLTDMVVSIIQPLEKTDHVETIDPTVMDLPFKDCYGPVFFAYRLADTTDDAYTKVLKQIKESLQKVLIPFFSFAGRWIAISKGSPKRKLLCNDAGVPLMEAYVDRDLDSVVKASAEFQPVPELQGYSVLGMDMTQFKQRIPPDSEGLPSLFVRITRFKCGGMVLAATFNHTLTDATGFFRFMTAWSDLCRTGETSIRVDHDRASTEIPSMRAKRHNEDITEGPDVTKAKVWAMKTFEVRKSVITSLKQEAKDGKLGPGYVATFDCIMANLWKGLAGLPPSLRDDKDVAMGFPVEGRSRFYDPPRPDLCGNAIMLAVPTVIPGKEVLQMPLVSIAERVRECLLKKIKEGLWLTFQDNNAYRSGKYARFATTSCANFPLYEINFGFGKPYYAIVGNTFYSQVRKTLGKASIHPPIPGSSSSAATVYVWSDLDKLQALQRDPQFLSFFLDSN